MKKLLKKFLVYLVVSSTLLGVQEIKALIPYYYQPSKKFLQKDSLAIGKSAYQLLYFGQVEDSLNLAKLAVKIDKSNETLWTILAETQIANYLYTDALISLSYAEKINPKMSEIYFAKSNIYIKQSKFKEAKSSIEKGIKISPKNFRGLFQLGNIYLIEKKYKKAIEKFNNAIIINKDFWQAINNKGLAFYELDDTELATVNFKQAISLEENAEPLLALATCLSTQDFNQAILLARKALIKNPKYVNYEYRKEQLWGEKLQKATEKLFENVELEEEISLAKTKINEDS